MDKWIFILEIIGGITFAISGSMEAIKAEMDLLGVMVLGVITATGGGVIRDVILGIHPPFAFTNPLAIRIALLTSFITFLFMYYNKMVLNKNIGRLFERGLVFFDACGLAVFAVTGLNIAYELSADYTTSLYIFVGVISGVGGGILRDILAGNKPYIFVRYVYASAAIIGVILDIILRKYLSNTSSMLISAIAIFSIRMIAAKKQWNLPTITNNKDEERINNGHKK